MGNHEEMTAKANLTPPAQRRRPWAAGESEIVLSLVTLFCRRSRCSLAVLLPALYQTISGSRPPRPKATNAAGGAVVHKFSPTGKAAEHDKARGLEAK